MKIEPKDVKKYLSLKGKVAVTGKYASSLTKDWFIKFGRGCKKVAAATLGAVVGAAVATKDAVVNTAVVTKDKVVDTKDKIVDSATSTMDKIKTAVLPSEETIQAKLEETREKKIENIDNKRNELKQFIGAMEQEDEYRIGLKQCYLKEIKNELRKLDKKRMNVSSKGLSVYALTKLTLNQYKNNMKRKWQLHLEKRAEKKQTKEVEANKRILEDNLKEQFRIQEENKAILAKYPELEKFFQEVYEKQYNEEKTESTGKTL